MSKKQIQVATIELAPARNDSYNNNCIKKYIFHWPLFVLGIILAICLAYYYIKVTKPVYPIMATLKFNAPTASSTGIPERQNAILQTLDPISKPVIVENEIEVLQSKKLMLQVVNDLQLWVNYIQINGGLNKDIYKAMPVKFQFVKQIGTIEPKGEKLEIFIKDHNSFVLKSANGNNKKLKFSTPVKSSFGTWQLLLTANFEDYIGSTIMINIQDPDLVADNYRNSLKAVLDDKDTPFVNLSTSDIVPTRGKDVLNSLLREYQKAALDDKNMETQKMLHFINLRLDSVSKELDTIDIRMANYKIVRGLTDIKSQAENEQEVKQSNIKALNDVDIQLKSIEVFERYFDSSPKSQKLPAIANIPDVILSNLYMQLSDLELERDKMIITMPQNNPKFDIVNKQISQLQDNFKERIQAIKLSLLTTKHQLQSIGSGFQSALKKIPLQDKEYVSMQRDQETKEKLYTDLLALQEQVSLKYGSVVSDSKIVDDAYSGKAKWPAVPIIYALALILGLTTPAGLLYARESFSNYITNRDQIDDETGVPIISELSYQEDINNPIVVAEGSRKFAIGEQFRVLRTNLYHLYEQNVSGRVTLFTSSIASEGKSFVSSNLAVTLAYADRKTILLDMDLRKPKIPAIFSLSALHPGISNYLSGETSDLETLIQPSGIQGLDILCGGSNVPNPSELLEKVKLKEMIAVLQTIYDDIIIDSPPIHLVTDAIIISRIADASLYVIRQGYTSKDELRFISGLNSDNRFPKLNIVFNGIKSGKYGYGYNSSNSYYNSYNTERKNWNSRSTLKRFFMRF